MNSWMERENITIFLRRCRNDIGINETSLFTTSDLHDGTNMIQVMSALHNLALHNAKVQKALPPPLPATSGAPVPLTHSSRRRQQPPLCHYRCQKAKFPSEAAP